MTDSEVLVLVRKLEQCQLALEEFHHRDHLAVAAAYLYASDLETAHASMRNSLLRFIAHYGRMGYHETITRFWMERVHERMDSDLCIGEFVSRIQTELADKNLIYAYYSKEVLSSPQAKERWIQPDLIHASK